MEDTDLQDGDIVAEILSKDPRNGYDTTTGTIDVGRTRALLTTLKTLHPQYTYSKHPDPKYRDRSWRQKSRTTSTQQQPQQSEQPQGSGTYGGYALEKLFGKKMEPNKAFKLKKSDPAAWAAARQAAHEAGLI